MDMGTIVIIIVCACLGWGVSEYESKTSPEHVKNLLWGIGAFVLLILSLMYL